jgi:hypothetical protein
MNSISASAAGRFKIGDRTINRLGYGAMRITGTQPTATDLTYRKN